MIWIPVTMSIVLPILLAGGVWVMFRRSLSEFQRGVVEALHVEIRKQDDRNRKGRAPEPSRNDDGKPPPPLPSLPSPYPGQPMAR